MRQLWIAVIGLVTLGLVAQVQAKKDPIKPLKGTVAAIEGTNIKVNQQAKDDRPAQDVVVQTDNTTAFTVDGAKAGLTDIKRGMKVRVTPATGIAMRVDAETPKPKPDAPAK